MFPTSLFSLLILIYCLFSNSSCRVGFFGVFFCFGFCVIGVVFFSASWDLPEYSNHFTAQTVVCFSVEVEAANDDAFPYPIARWHFVVLPYASL